MDREAPPKFYYVDPSQLSEDRNIWMEGLKNKSKVINLEDLSCEVVYVSVWATVTLHAD